MKLLEFFSRLILFIFFALLFSINSIAQSSKIDSLSKLLYKEKVDSNKATLLWRMAEQYQSFKPDTALQLAQKALFLSRKIKFVEGESRALGLLATSQYLLGDYPKALDNYTEKLKIEEKRSSPRNYSSALNNIGITYILLEEYSNALEYLYRADSIVNAVGGQAKEELKYNITINIGEAYSRMKNSDSAAAYFNTALLLATQQHDTASMGAAILGQANVLALQEQAKEALPNYLLAYNYLKTSSDNDILSEVSLGLAKVYEKISNNDSAIYFGNWSYALAKKSNFLSRQLDAAFFLSRNFYLAKRYDSAFYFLQEAVELQNSVKGNEKIKAAMILSINEKLRQQEIAEQKIRDQEQRWQQLQWSLIAICIPLFFLVYNVNQSCKST